MDLYIIYRASGEWEDYVKYAVGIALSCEQAQATVDKFHEAQVKLAQMIVENAQFYEEFLQNNSSGPYSKEFEGFQRMDELESRYGQLTQAEEVEVAKLVADYEVFYDQIEIEHQQWVEAVWKPAYFEFCGKMGRDIEECQKDFIVSVSQGEDPHDDSHYFFNRAPLIGEIPAELSEVLARLVPVSENAENDGDSYF